MRLHSILRWLKAWPLELDFLNCIKAQHLYLIGPWKSYSISEQLNFIICKMEAIKVSPRRTVVRDETGPDAIVLVVVEDILIFKISCVSWAILAWG